MNALVSKKNNPLSKVENIWLAKSGHKLMYPDLERIGVIEVDNFPALGKLAALRFIEWVQENPSGVISLPTGKTPEHFIKWVIHYLENWDTDNIKTDLEENGINPGIKPDMASLHFVQIDEFYPINPKQTNSFYYYVNKYYIDGFGLDPKKALLIDTSKIGISPEGKFTDIFPGNIVDLSLRVRQPATQSERAQKNVITKVDQWCTNYEDKIRQLGGIGFFLGGIGPDGHIAFNVRGSDFHSTTRLTPTNYETQAAAASDLGGIEVSRNRLVITIGLSTITFNKQVTAIIFAAGEAKAGLVCDAIQQQKCNNYPASVLHDMPNARFYLTRGAARFLTERVFLRIKNTAEISTETMERVIIDLAVKNKKRLSDLTEDDFNLVRSSKKILTHFKQGVSKITGKTIDSIKEKI